MIPLHHPYFSGSKLDHVIVFKITVIWYEDIIVYLLLKYNAFFYEIVFDHNGY